MNRRLRTALAAAAVLGTLGCRRRRGGRAHYPNAIAVIGAGDAAGYASDRSARSRRLARTPGRRAPAPRCAASTRGFLP